MGTIGGIFGLIFYALVLIAAISSAISLIEAVSVTFIDHASAKGHERDRNKVLAVVCLAITLLPASSRLTASAPTASRRRICSTSTPRLTGALTGSTSWI